MEYHEDDQSGDEFDAYLYGVGPEYQKKKESHELQRVSSRSE